MTEFPDKATKRLYLKSKLIVKKWEEEFSTKNGRLPTKTDIKLSPAHVKESYNRYYKIKTELLASQILTEDDSTCDGFADKTLSPLNECNSQPQVEKEDEKNDDIQKTEPTNNDLSNTNTTKNNEISPNVWGSELNVKKAESKQIKEAGPSINFLKLVKGSSFKKRNPRKPLSSSKNKGLKSKTQNGAPEDKNNSHFIMDSSSLVDSEECESTINDSSNLQFSMDSSTMSRSFTSLPSSPSPLSSSFLSTSGIISGISKPETCAAFDVKFSAPSKLSLIQEITSGSSGAINKTVPCLHEGWVERCVDALEEKVEPKRNSDSGFDSIGNSPLFSEPTKDQRVDDGSSDDDIICDSDNEIDGDNTRTSFSNVSQKRKSVVLQANALNEEKLSISNLEENIATLPPTPVHTAKRIRLELNDKVENADVFGKDTAKKAILERKMKSGTLNENYVKINLEKKVYVRGKKNFNFSKYKKQQWKKDKKMLNSSNARESGGVVQCYKCGEKGHFSSKCKHQLEDKLLEVDNEDEEDDLLPTLDEVQAMAEEKAKLNNFIKKNVFSFEKPTEEPSNLVGVEPYYQLDEIGSVLKTPPEVFEALEQFGHSEFRPGQEEAIMRILSGLSTLLMVSTGGGKSLCYQLPAYLYAKRSKCITLVISPLVSLMEDQVSGSSSIFKAGCLHTSQTQKQRDVVLENAKNGKLQVLLVSPEAVVSGDSSKGFGSIFKQLPPIAFACIDEVHCISQWSHNFRPSYLMINKVLKEKFKINTILGLTATATVSSIKSITKELGISSERDVIKDIPLPNNLFLSISRDVNKEDALIQLLNSSKFQEFNAILIYCTRRDDCERLAVLIRTVLQNSAPPIQTKGNRKKLAWNVESYHAGMAAARRKQVQKAFMSGNLRIVVATVAFGMGINKQDIRAVIHYNMPRDFESYVQETGRAGRDGKPAHCHLFLDPDGRDLNELRRHIYGNSIDRHVLRKLLQRVFVECDCPIKNKKCEGHEVAFNCQDTIQALDLPEENIYTLLCYLELHEKKFIKVLAPAYMNCRVKSYQGLRQINLASLKCPPLAYACTLNAQNQKKKSSLVEFNVIDVANKICWDSGLVKSQLKNLEWEMREDSSWKKTGISVEFCDLGFRVLTRGDMRPAEQDEALDYLTERVENQEKRAVAQLNLTFSTLDYFACSKYSDAVDDIDEDNSNELKAAIRHYFETETMLEEIPLKNLEISDFEDDIVAADVRSLLCNYRDNAFNARAVARIFHGIQSPNYPASLWYNCRFWRKHMDKDFNKILEIAKLEILRQKL